MLIIFHLLTENANRSRAIKETNVANQERDIRCQAVQPDAQQLYFLRLETFRKLYGMLGPLFAWRVDSQMEIPFVFARDRHKKHLPDGRNIGHLHFKNDSKRSFQ